MHEISESPFLVKHGCNSSSVVPFSSGTTCFPPVVSGTTAEIQKSQGLVGILDCSNDSHGNDRGYIAAFGIRRLTSLSVEQGRHSCAVTWGTGIASCWIAA